MPLKIVEVRQKEPTRGILIYNENIKWTPIDEDTAIDCTNCIG